MLATAAGVSLRSVQRVLAAHQLAPHRLRGFKLSKDREFADKLKDIVGLHVDPPAHAVVLSVDEKSQIQPLDRTQPGLPVKKRVNPLAATCAATAWAYCTSGRRSSAMACLLPAPPPGREDRSEIR